jgi:hypothetical protein
MATEIHRWRSGDGDPTLASSWDSGVAPGTLSTSDLTFTAAAANNDTVTIAGVVYTFKTTINDATPREVFNGASATASATNLRAAINKDAGGGTLYSSATVAHKDMVAKIDAVTASNPSGPVVRATAYSYGIYANIAVTETSANASWSVNPLSGGVSNWATSAVALFDGIVNVACQGTDRLDGMAFTLRQTKNAMHNIGTISSPFRWRQNSPNGSEHILEGGGQVYFGAGIGATTGWKTTVRFTVNRLEGSYLEFQQDPLLLIVSSGQVSVNRTVGSSIGPILIDGLDAEVTIISGKLTLVWSRNGRFISNSVSTSDDSAAIWTVVGGFVQNKTRMIEGTRVMISGGTMQLIPTIAPANDAGPQFYVSGGILDLAESVFEITGLLVLFPGGQVLGTLVSPELTPV